MRSKVFLVLVLSTCIAMGQSVASAPPAADPTVDARIATTDAQLAKLGGEIAALYKQLNTNPTFQQWIALQREKDTLEGDQKTAKMLKVMQVQQAAHAAAAKAMADQAKIAADQEAAKKAAETAKELNKK